MMDQPYRGHAPGPRKGIRHSVRTLVFGLVSASWSVAAPTITAEDTVVLWSRDGSQQVRTVGDVLDFRGSGLQLRHRSGREETIPAERVIDIQTQRHPQHVVGDEKFDNGLYAEAVRAYADALRSGPRDWVRRGILARSIQCLVRLQRTEQAVEAFLLIWDQDPQTPHFGLIPLPWTTQATPASLQNRARNWMSSRDSSAARLIGAGWLVTSAQRSDALRVLRELARSEEPRIAFLAEAQLWRTQVVTATIEDAARWGERIQRMPELLRGGPYFVVGRLWARHNRHDEAAIALLKAALLHPELYPLAAESLLAAARELAKMDQRPHAARLCEEILARFPESDAAPQAARELDALGTRTPSRDTQTGSQL
jgi:tetratricopeptide (TPR) repeat protein